MTHMMISSVGPRALSCRGLADSYFGLRLCKGSRGGFGMGDRFGSMLAIALSGPLDPSSRRCKRYHPGR
jgi:hypothetical protein